MDLKSRIDFQLLHLSSASREPHGYETTPSELQRVIASNLSESHLTIGAIMMRVRELSGKLIRLQKRDEKGRLRTYRHEREANEFFYHGRFFITITNEGRDALEDFKRSEEGHNSCLGHDYRVTT